MDTLPQVDLLISYIDEDVHEIDSAIANGAKGIVIAGSGAASTSSALVPYIDKAMGEGVPVVVATRTGSGAAPATEGGSFIYAGFLNPPHARIQLQLSLATGLGMNETKAGFGNILDGYIS